MARRGSWVAVWLLIVSVTVIVPLGVGAKAAPHEDLARLVRSFDLDDLALSDPAGVAFSELSGSFFITEGSPDGSGFSVAEVTSDEVRKGSARIDALVRDPMSVAFDEAFGRLLVYADPAGHLVEVPVDESGDLDPRSVTRHNVRQWDVGEAAGLAVDPESGILFILDISVPRIVQIVPGPDGSFDDAVVEGVDLRQAGIADPASIAYDRSTGNVFVASSSRPLVHEVSDTGALLATWDVSEAELASPGGMVVAASGDLTDDPAQMSLYITDQGEPGSSVDGAGQFVEVSLVAAPEVSSSTSFTASLVNEIEAFKWSPPSPDTSGVAYLPATNTLMAADGEVNETAIYAGANMFEATLAGSLTDTFTTIDFGNNEPTGVSVNPSNNHLFISRDTPPKQVFEMDPGADGEYSTADDTITSFVTADFGANDPEGVAYAPGLDHLFVADGVNNEVYEVSPGGNGVFDGVSPNGDDLVVGNFDTLVHGMENPEGIAYNPDTATLYIAGKTRNIGTRNLDTLLETTTSGAFVRTIDVSAVNPDRQYPKQKLSGLAYGPSSQDPNAMSIYIADRGEDNNNDPNENDGRIYEVTAPSGGGGGGSGPVARDDSAVTGRDTPVTVDVAGNDSDSDGDLVVGSASTVAGPSDGATSDNGDGTITYTPDLGFTGSDSFTYEICDSTGLCDMADVAITVTQPNDPPVANDDLATTGEDVAVTVDVAGNDSDSDGNLVVGSASTVAGPSDGATSDNGDGTITYTPNQDFNGSDSFTYEICDDLGLCDSGLVTVTVDPVADPPVAVDDSASTAVNTDVTVDVAANDSDVDGDLDPSSAVTVSGPSSGVTSDNGDGTITYTPSVDFTGSDSFVYEVCDATTPIPHCDQATVSVTVSGDQVIHVTSTSGGSVGGVSFKDEDIVAFDTSTGTWSMFFDGSDVGLGATGQEIDGFHVDTDGSMLISLGAAGTLPNVGAVDDHDIVRFTPTSIGETTAGSYVMFFNGEDHGLTTSGEDIDSVGFAPDGRLVVSLRGSYSVPGVNGRDVDLLAFDNGSWSLYLDGIAVGLDGGNTEDVTASWIDTNGDVYLSVRSSFNVPGLSGDAADIFTCAPDTTGPITQCTFSMFWDGSEPAHGFGSESINGMHLGG